MIYKWKIPGIIPVDAQIAGLELTRIYEKNNRLDPSEIVEESRSTSAPLHPCFEWDDQKAAEKYRESQASCIIRSIVTIQEKSKHPQEIRAFVHVQNTYKPIHVVINSEEQMAELLRSALLELEAFRKKYNSIKELAPVFDAMKEIGA